MYDREFVVVINLFCDKFKKAREAILQSSEEVIHSDFIRIDIPMSWSDQLLYWIP